MISFGSADVLKTACNALVLCVIGVVAAGCAGETSEPSSVESGNFSEIPGQFPTPAVLTANGQAEAPVGGCVNLSGPLVNASLKVVDCGSEQHTYRIIRRVNVPRECGDTDRSVYSNSRATGQYTACLDLAWDASSCLSLGVPVTKVACSDVSAPKKIKPLKVILDTITLEGCADGGYVHQQRRFTVCTQSLP